MSLGGSTHGDRYSQASGRIPQVIHIVGSYQGENVRSRPISETKHLWACSVLRWGTTRESQVTNVFACGLPQATRRVLPLSLCVWVSEQPFTNGVASWPSG